MEYKYSMDEMDKQIDEFYDKYDVYKIVAVMAGLEPPLKPHYDKDGNLLPVRPSKTEKFH
ncbi:hypothetical protein [Schleiferilactobacillus shenzhenensis]|uniref:Uncharacterized protein n=1 Tax=Schleiferilactobacillus shenzhenensis LY-73 TaxID=1231336 RepID=U4TTS6_9LACO|nr:hypothetical protein [Schleiferilactobacillus shenzhenensis]ERL64827.1 hypothetical protein L248_0604 [Schleiferilactobacillus shenzhenensis LY-73]